MFMAAKHNSLESFKTLHNAGADFKLVDDQGDTLLHEASKLGHLTICKVSYNGSIILYWYQYNLQLYRYNISFNILTLIANQIFNVFSMLSN